MHINLLSFYHRLRHKRHKINNSFSNSWSRYWWIKDFSYVDHFIDSTFLLHNMANFHIGIWFNIIVENLVEKNFTVRLQLFFTRHCDARYDGISRESFCLFFTFSFIVLFTHLIKNSGHKIFWVQHFVSSFSLHVVHMKEFSFVFFLDVLKIRLNYLRVLIGSSRDPESLQKLHTQIFSLTE